MYSFLTSSLSSSQAVKCVLLRGLRRNSLLSSVRTSAQNTAQNFYFTELNECNAGTVTDPQKILHSLFSRFYNSRFKYAVDAVVIAYFTVSHFTDL
jgi:hypothetical protein